MSDRKIIADTGSAVVDELVRNQNNIHAMPMFQFPDGTVTAWGDQEEHAHDIPIYTANGEQFLRDIFFVCAQALAASAADNVRVTLRRRNVLAAVNDVIAQFVTSVAGMTPGTLVAFTRYSLKGIMLAGGTAFTDGGITLSDQDVVTLQVDNVVLNGSPLAGATLLLDVHPVPNRLVKEPQGLPRFYAFQEATRQSS